MQLLALLKVDLYLNEICENAVQATGKPWTQSTSQNNSKTRKAFEYFVKIL